MAFELNEKIKNLKSYDPICGDYPIRLDANESFLQPPEDIKNEISKAVSGVALNRYPDSLAKEICEVFATLINVPKELVVAGNGSDEMISVIMTAFLQKGDRVVTLSPDFSMYKFYAGLVECECTEFRKDENFKVDFEALTHYVNSSNARMVIFSNPCNPTSVGFDAQDIKKLIENTDALIVLDEAYMDFWNQSLVPQVNDCDNLIILKTCSKALGFACARLGFAIADKRITDAIKAAKSPYNVNSLTQVSAAVLLCHADYIRCATELIVKSREMLYSELKEIERQLPERLKLYESNTNFVFVRTDEAERIFEHLKSKGIIVRNMNGYLRITAGSEFENLQLINAVKEFYKVG